MMETIGIIVVSMAVSVALFLALGTIIEKWFS